MHAARRHLAPLPDWAERWTAPGGGVTEEGRAWLRQRPACVQALMVRLPPSCLVRLPPAPDGAPPPFLFGIVSSYFEDDHVTVRPGPDACRHAWVRVCADKLEVLGYYASITPEAVRQALGTPRA